MKSGRDLKQNSIFGKIILVVVMFIITTTFFYSETQARYITLHDYEDTLSFVGDIYPRESTTIKAYKRDGGIKNVVHESYDKILKNSEYVIGNLECCISDRGEAYDKQYTFRVNPEYRNIIKEANIDLVTVANNHSLDYGEEALKDTIINLKETKVDYVGAGDNIVDAAKPFIKNIKNRKYVIYAASAVAPTHKWFAGEDSFGINNGYNLISICADIKKRRKVDKESAIIVYMHWGDEKAEYPSTYQRDCAISLIEAGCDLVVGSHPHVFQNIEYYKNVPIVYSLGNFIYGETETDTMVLDAVFDYSTEGKKKVYFKIHPGISGFERVVMYGYKEEREAKVNNILTKCPMCEIDNRGYIVEKQE